MSFVKRLFLFVGVLVVLYFGSLILAGGIVGGIAGAKTHDAVSGGQAGGLAAIQFSLQYRSIFFGAAILIAALAAFGAKALTFLVALPVAVGGFFLLEQSRPKPEEVARAIPLLAAHATPAPADIAAAKQRAIALFSQLGIPNSPLNREFLRRYNDYQTKAKSYFDDPEWPSKLAKESDEALKK